MLKDNNRCFRISCSILLAKEILQTYSYSYPYSYRIHIVFIPSGEGRKKIAPPNFQNLGEIIIFPAATRKYFRKTTISKTKTSYKKNLGKFRNFKAVTRIKKFIVPNAEKSLQ